MSDPTTGAVATAAGATGLGMMLGLQVDAMLIGFIAGLVVLMHIPPPRNLTRTPARVFFLVAGSAFAAGVGAPLLMAFIASFDWARSVDITSLRLVSAAIIGAGMHIPAARRFLKEKLEK